MVGYPLLRLLSAASRAGEVEGLGRPLLATAWTSLAVSALALVVATAGAVVTERLAGRARSVLRVGMLVPILVPPFAAALSWLRAYGPGGLLDDLLGVPLPGLVGPAGVVLVMTVNAVPLAYAVIAGSLATRADPERERAARAAGAGPWTAFRHVTLPLLRPALLGAAALVFVSSVNAFGIPAILGLPAGFTTVTTSIYRDLAFSAAPASFERALLLAAVLVGLALVGALGAEGGMRRGGARLLRVGRPVHQGGSGAASALLAVYLIGATLVPLLALVAFALTRAVGLAPVPSNWTLANFQAALSGDLLAALARSSLLAVATAGLVLALGGLLTVLGRRTGGTWLGTVALLGFALPGSTLAVALLLSYGRWLRDTLLLVLLAYVAKLWAVGHRSLAAAADSLPADLPRAARASGAGPLATLRTVGVPLLAPAVAVAWLLVFLLALHELTMSSLLYGPGSETVAVLVLNLQQLGDVSVTSALAVVLILPAGAVAWVLLRLLSGRWGWGG